jgi:hypothetical protein
VLYITIFRLEEKQGKHKHIGGAHTFFKEKKKNRKNAGSSPSLPQKKLDQ